MPGYRPSKRRHKTETDVELKLIPVMSLLVVLVPMLLQTAVFEELAAVQLNLPSRDDVREVVITKECITEGRPPLMVTARARAKKGA